MKVLDKLSVFLITFIGAIIITGGYDYVSPTVIIEFSQVSLFGLTLTLFCLYMHSTGYFARSQTFRMVDGLVNRLSHASAQNTYLFIFSVMAWLFLTRLVRHYTLNTDLMDVSCVHQALFYAFSPTLLHCDACRNGTQMAEHIAWIFVLISPLFSFLKSDFAVFLFKFLTVTAGVIWFLKNGPLKKQKKFWLLAFLFLFASKSFRASQVWDFREDDLAFVFLLVSCAAIYSGRMILFWCSLMLTLICKENMAFVTLFFAPILWMVDSKNSFSPLTRRQRLFHGVMVALVSLIYAALVIKVFTPYFLRGAEQLNNIVLRFPGMGSTLEEVLINFIKSPSKLAEFIFNNLLSFSTLKYVLLLVAPFCVLGVRGLPWLIGVVPGLLMNCLQAAGNQRMMIFHYDLVILPFLFMALCVGLSRINLKKERLTLFFALGLALSAFDRPPSAEIRSRLLKDANRIVPTLQLSQLQLSAPVAANSRIWAHLNHLPDLRLVNFPEGPMPINPNEIRAHLVLANPLRKISDQGRDPADAKFLILDLKNPWQAFLSEELKQEGEVVIQGIPESTPMFLVFELHESLFSFYCRKLNLCRL